MDLRLLPDMFSLAVFIVGTRPLVRRAGSHTNLWFLGWAFVLVHDVALLFDSPQGPPSVVLNLISLWAMELCALSFLYVSANVPRRRMGLIQLAEVGVPVLLQSVLFVFQIHTASIATAACLLFLAPAVDLLIRPRRRNRPMMGLSAALAALGLAMIPFAAASPRLVTLGSLALLFLGSAYLYLSAAPRMTRGVVAVVGGLTAWGLSYPGLAWFALEYPETPLDHTLTELPRYLVAAAIMLTLLEEHVERTERMAMHDPLTDLPNRRLFEERLILTMEEARQQRTTIACLVIDVDNFKTINDTLGHEAGDQLLRALAVRLSWHMSPRDILARTGGDEFTALLAGVTDEHHLRFIASAMMSAGSVPVLIDGRPVDVNISIGIALSPDDADDIDGLRRAADEAMYVAKRRGGSMLAFAGED